VCPPSISELHSRLLKRNTDKPEVIAKRLENSTGEIGECIELWHMFKHRILNKDLERSSQEFLGIIEALYEEELELKKE
jgi:guanylate kinase